MAYLTNYSFKQLVEQTEIQNIDRISLEFFTAKIYDNQHLYYFFNQLELKKLFRSIIILSDDKSYVLVYRNVPERIDDYCFILPVEGKVKYHMKLDCESLNRGFKNFFMPEVIIRLEKKEPEKHQNIVEDIRNWFVQNNYTISRYEKNEINSSEMTMNFNSHFPKKYDIEPISISDKLEDNFEWYISKKTNKIDETKNEFNYDDFIKNIFLVIKKRHTLCNSLDKDNLSRFDYMLKMVDTDINVETDSGKLSNLKYCISKMGIAKLKEFWSEHINLKNQVTKMLTEYFKWSYNFKEKQFDAIYLESFNLAKCRMCKDE